MGRYVDLTIPLGGEIPRWEVKIESLYNTNIAYKESRISMSVHTGTHLDAPLHYFENGVGVDKFPLELSVSEALILNLSHVGKNYPISSEDIKECFRVDYPEVIILRTDWPTRCWKKLSFWEEAPYLSEEGAAWLAKRDVKMIGYDFPQDYAIRNILKGKVTTPSDFKVHQEILAKGIWQIEYLTNLHLLNAERIELIVCPLPLSNIDGSPVRALGRLK